MQFPANSNYDRGLYHELISTVDNQLQDQQLAAQQRTEQAGSLLIDPHLIVLEVQPLSYGHFPVSLLRHQLRRPLIQSSVQLNVKRRQLGARLPQSTDPDTDVPEYATEPRLTLTDTTATADCVQLAVPFYKKAPYKGRARLLDAQYVMGVGSSDGIYDSFVQALRTRVLAIGDTSKYPESVTAHAGQIGGHDATQTCINKFLQANKLQQPRSYDTATYVNDVMRLQLGLIALAATEQ